MTLALVGFASFASSRTAVEGGAFPVTDMFGFEPTGRLGAGALAALSNIYGFITMIFAGLFIATEFSQGTIRNTLCVGVSRTKVYLAKLAVSAVVLALCMFLSCITFITGFTVAYGFGGMTAIGDFVRDTATVFVMQFLYHLTYTGLGCLLAFLIPNIVVSVAIGICSVFFSGVLLAVCADFDALKNIVTLMPLYYVKGLNEQLHNTAFLVRGAVLCIIFVAITAVAGCVTFKKQDIK